MRGNGRLLGAAIGALIALAGCTSTATPHTARPSAGTSSTSVSPATTAAASKTASTRPTRTLTHTTQASRSVHRASHAETGLPLRMPTGDARQVITVSAPSTHTTSGTLQAWQRSGGSWQRVGPAVRAWLGTAGLTTRPSESTPATPIGSFTLTRAFGHDPDPGTALPYTRTTPDDWWISQPGRLYNTMQRCASTCPFTRGAPNEHLYYELPYYRYALVIDYNTSNAPGGVRQGAGSAFFLHVTVGAPTQGCVSIAPDQLVRLLRWLRPSDHPRILIGTR